MTATLTGRRLNLGSGQYPLDGWTNVDAYCAADVQLDFFDCDFSDVTEVRMSHVLEHVSWRQTLPLLEHVRSWMRTGGLLIVEVPDMTAIMARGTTHPLWFKYVYGDQSHGGEFHLSGWTESALLNALEVTGWHVEDSRRLDSDHMGREGMPCIEATATA